MIVLPQCGQEILGFVVPAFADETILNGIMYSVHCSITAAVTRCVPLRLFKPWPLAIYLQPVFHFVVVFL